MRLVPYDPRTHGELEPEGAEGLPDACWVVAEVLDPLPLQRAARARVRESLGDAAAPGVDTLVVLRHYGIPDRFPRETEAEAAALPEEPEPAHWAGREDHRQATVVTIDGETARDFDDAISVERLPGGGFRLAVHIADVAHYVREGSALDLEACRRGTSVYYPDRVVPMLPGRLSDGLCSLRPEVPRLTVAALLEFDGRGKLVRRRFAECVIRSRRRLTYTEVSGWLADPTSAGSGAGDLLGMLAAARDLMEVLHRARRDRGSIDFDLPEGDVILDTDGYVVGIRPGERTVAHRIIEELMIAANEAVARELHGHDCPALYRVHDPPRREDLEQLRELLLAFAIELPLGPDHLHPGVLQRVLARVQGRPEEGFVSTLVLRTMQRAVYSPNCSGHYALAARYYAHFTSPIRRYPDLLVHRRLKALLHGRAAEEAAATALAERLTPIAERASATERRAEQSERDLLQWKKVRFLSSRVGEGFSGRVSGVQPFGLFVQLDGYSVDGLVGIRTLADDEYLFEPEAHRLVGQGSGRAFRLGDPVEVVLAGVEERYRGLDLRIVGMPAGGLENMRRARGRRPPAGSV